MSANLSNATFRKYLEARNDYLKGKYQLSSRKLISLNRLTQNDDVNHLLAKSLYRDHRYQAAGQVIMSDLNSYSSSKSLARLMINVLLKNRAFIICREIITSFRNSEFKAQLLRQVHQSELRAKDLYADDLQQTAQRFYHLSSFSLIKQRIVIQQAQRLPLNNFLKISKYLLVDPFLKPIIRLSILDIIRKVGLKIKLRYQWIDHQVYVVDTTNLRDLTKTHSYQKMMKMIDSKYFHNPAQELALKQTLRLDLSYLYPFNDQRVRHFELWIKVAELRLQGKQPSFANLTATKIYKLQVKLNRLTNNLVK